MTLTLAELSRVVEELNESVRNANIQKVHQPAESAIVLQARVPGETHHIYLCAEYRQARVHLLALPPKNPPEPPAFCRSLRKHLIGSIIESAEIVSNDRVARFNCRLRRDDQMTKLSLILELIPGTENIILTREDDTIIAALRHVTLKDGRAIRPRHRYEPPAQVSAQDVERDAGQLAAQDRTDRFEETVREKKLATYSAAIEQAYAGTDEAARTAQLQRELESLLNKLQKKLRRRLEKIRGDYEATSHADRYQRMGEALKANLHAIPRGSKQIELPDPENPVNTLAVEIDPSIPPIQNMKNYFKRARKLRGGRKIIAERLADTESELEELSRLAERVGDAAGLAQLEQLSAELERRGIRRRQPGKREEVKSKPREFISADGQTILVGRNPRQNDELTLHASGNDYWLHVQHYPGSHVIIKMEKDKPLQKETLLDAAHLAMHFSKLRDASKAPIDYTRRQDVKKPRNSPPGRVTYSQQKTFMLVPDAKRLERLLKRSEKIM